MCSFFKSVSVIDQDSYHIYRIFNLLVNFVDGYINESCNCHYRWKIVFKCSTIYIHLCCPKREIIMEAMTNVNVALFLTVQTSTFDINVRHQYYRHYDDDERQ